MKKIDFNNLEELLSFNIKYYRYLNGLSQEKLSELTNLVPSYISDIERGRHMPTIKNIANIAKALDIGPYILLKNVERDNEILSKINSTRQYNQNNRRDTNNDKTNL